MKRAAKKRSENLIPRAKVAARLGVCTRTIKRKEKPKGLLTPYKLSRTITAYPESEVETLIAQSRVA